MAVDTCWKSQELVGLLSTIIDYRGKTPPKSSSGIPLISAANVKGGKLVFNSPSFISHEDFKEWTKRGFTQPGDVLITTEAPAGEVAPYPLHGVFQISRRVMALRPNLEKLDSGFLLYALLWPELKQRLLTLSRGTTVPRVLKTDITAIQIPLPPLSEQKAIASILGSLDDKIELNRRMNETLESMARAIFKSWFVDFDPVRAKMDGRQPAGMDQATADLFPDAFEDSPLGQIPAGWSAAPFKKHVTVERGLSYKGSGLSDSGVPMHNLNSILEGGGYKYAGIKFYAGDYKEKHVVVPGDLIVTNTEQGFNHLLIGHAAIVPEQFGAMGIFSHHIYRVRLIEDSPLSPQYFVHLINMRRWHELIAGFSNGTTINMLPKDALEKPMLIEPPKELVSKFTDFANTSAQRTEHSVVQNARLAILRDTLLPKLLSGELRVKDAEKAVSSAL